MNAAEIAREYLEASNQRIEDDDTAPDITDADVHVLCRAVLDAEAYRARVEGEAVVKDKLMELAQQWKKEPLLGVYRMAVHACADDLIYHLNAEDNAEAYRARVERVANDMQAICARARGRFPHSIVRKWAAQLTEKK